VVTQEIGTFKGSDSTTTTAAYVVRDLVRDDSNDNVYFTKQDAPIGVELTDTSYFELLVDVATVRQLKVDAETAKTDAETAQTGAEAALASFEGQFKTGATNPYSGTPDNGDLWYDTANNILKYYVTGTGFEPVTTSLATVTDNYLTISNQVITAGTVPISLGGTGGTSASEARTLLGVTLGSDVQAYDAGLQSISGLTTAANKMIYTTASDTYAVTDLTAFARTILDDADAATVRTTLGLDSAATTPSSDYATAAQGTLADSATQPGDNATTLNVSATDKLLGRSTAGAGSVEEITLTSAGRALLDDADAAAQRTTLGLGTISTQASDSVSITGGSVTGITDLAIADGGTGASSVSVARSNLLPNYSGNGSKVLALNSGGTDVEWVTQSQVFTAGVANAFEHPNSVTDSFTVSASDHRFYIAPITFSGTISVAGKMLVFDGPLNTTGTINVTGELNSTSIDHAVEHPNLVTTSFTVPSNAHRYYVGPVSFSGTQTIQGKMLIFDGLYNQLGTANVSGLLKIRE
jgi:hypothetical protein